MSATRGMLRSLAEACCTPGEVLTKLNRLLVNDFPAGKFVTMVYAVLDPVAHTVVFANAGHLRPLFIDDRGDRAAGTAPRRPEIDQHRFIRLQHVRIEVRVRDFYD
jgi:serine phosphatase RsbU (regulator of sigma subunit)